jgi:transcriptional regulator with XRE-family HTH domain
MTQTQLGTQLGVSCQQVQKYECGANSLNAWYLWRAALSLNVPISYFFRSSVSRTAPSAKLDRDALFLTRRVHRLEPTVRRRISALIAVLSDK